jgi:TRAP transporter 4TM/12TM fusion protein
MNRVLTVLALVVVGYHVADVFFSLNSAMHHYTAHLGLILAAAGIQTALEGRQRPPGWARFSLVWIGSASTVIALFASAYLYLNNAALEMSQPFLSPVEFAVGLMLLGVLFALNWIVWGAALTVVCLAAALYFGFGDLVPGPMADLALDAGVIMSNLAGMGSPRGLFMYIPLSADTILLLLVYGGLMSGTKVLDMFGELGNVIGNYLRGGVAYSCITASSLIGMVTGQTVSCIALTGSMTIPTMIRGGLSKEEAGAIEVLAANGSQIIPPIMGLGAFLMAVIIGMPYVEIAKAAIFPAILYVLVLVIGVWCVIHGSRNICFVRQQVDWQRLVWVLPSFVPSIATIIILLSLRYSANFAAFWGTVILLSLSFLRPRALRPSLNDIVSGMRSGVIAAAQLGLVLAAIGIVVQVLLTSGLGTSFSSLMIQMSGRNVDLALLIGMTIALIIGMGLPTPAAYSLCTIVMIPPLIDVGVEPLVAHFFGFYFAVLSAITPPVAVGILMAVRISRGSFWRTAMAAMKLGGVCLILPFFMVAFPDSLRFPNISLETMFAALVLCFGTLALGAAAYGFLVGPLSKLQRATLYASMVPMLVYFKSHQIWLGAAVIAIVLLTALYRWKEARWTQPVLVEAEIRSSASSSAAHR